MNKLIFVGLWALCGLGVGADESIFWLDKESAEAAYEKLTSVAEGKRDSGTWVKMGWAELLYQNDADKALDSFQKAAEKDPKNGDAWEGVQTAALARLRTPLTAKAVKELLESEPDSARTEAYLRVGRVQAGVFACWTVPERIKFAQGLLAKTKNPLSQHALRDWLTDLFTTQLRTDEAFLQWQAQGHVAKWHVLGFFGQYGAAAYDDELPPEREFKPTAEYKVGREMIHWNPVELGPGDIDPTALTRPFENRGSVCYIAAVLDCPEEREGFIRLATELSTRVWLNGVEVGSNDLFRSYASRERFHGVTFSAGPNLLLVKLASGGAAWWHDLTLHHADGRPMTDLKAGFEGKVPEFKASGKEANPGRAWPSDALEEYRRKIENFEACSLRDVVMFAQLASGLGLHEEAHRADRRAFEATVGSAYMQYVRGANVGADPLLPDSRRANIARTHYERAISLDPRFAPALFQLASVNETKDSEKALDYLLQTVAANPECDQAWSMLSRIYAARGWEAEQENALVRAAASAPGNWQLQEALAQFHRNRQNLEKALAITTAIRKENELEGIWSEIDILIASGKDPEAFAALEAFRRRFPKNARCPFEMAGIHQRAGRNEDAEAALKLAMQLDPKSGETVKRLLSLYLSTGQTEKAKGTLEVILAEPARMAAYDEASRRYLSHLSGESEDWTKPWDVDVAELVKNAPSTDSFPKSAHSVILFDQKLVRVIGKDFKWKEEDVHRVVKILSKEGGENYGQLRLGGGEWARFRIRQLRVFTPDGRVLEMDAIQEEGLYRMPELDRGAILEMHFVRANGPIGVDQPVFDLERSPFFRRQNEPILWSRYVVQAPKGAPVRVKSTNLSVAAVETETEKTTTWTWEFRDQPEYIAESSMPPGPEILPNIRFIFGKASMEGLIERYRTWSMGPPLADDVRAKSEELTRGLDDPAAKVRALYNFVVTEIKPGQNNVPSHVLVEKEGQTDNLFCALLQAAGIPFCRSYARPALNRLRDHDPETENPPYLTEILLVRAGGKDIWLWPQSFVAFGALPNEIYGGEALVVEGRSVTFRTLPSRAPEENCVQIRLDVTLDSEAMADVRAALIFTEGRAGMVLGQLKRDVAPDQLKNIIAGIANQFFKGINVSESGTSEFMLESATSEVWFKGATKHFAQKKSGGDVISFRTVVPPMTLGAQVIRESERKFPLRASWADDVARFDVIVVHLPEYTEIRVPESVSISNEFGTYHLHYKLEGQTLTLERRFVVVAQDIATDRFAAFAETCKAIDDAEKRQVFLRVKSK